jgi:hypothetical protein
VKARISATLCALTILAGAAPAGAAPATPTVPTFGPHSGFAKAILEREPITVGLVPDFAFGQERPLTVEERIEWLDPMLDAWNTAAGWEVLVQVTDDSVADITFRTVVDDHPRCGDDAGACTWIDEFPAGEYRFRHAFIELWPWFPPADVVAHELGHALGFICEGVAPLDPDYHGVMIHDRPWGMTPDNEYDRASLVEAGYRTEDR